MPFDVLRRLFVHAPAAGRRPVDTSDDEVYPIHTLDGREGTQNLLLSWMLRFDDVLDAQMLYRSLCRLIELGDWRKLGGRYRRNQASCHESSQHGKLELHVPKQFTLQRPAVNYSHGLNLEMAMEKDAVGQHLPRQADRPYFQSSHVDFMPLMGPANMPTTLEQMTDRDMPQLQLHIESFQDGTLVTVSFPHVLMDGIGFKSVLTAWSLVLAGREQDVPAVHGAKTDVLQSACIDEDQKGEELVLKAVILRRLNRFLFYSRLLLDRWMNPEPQRRIIFLPAAVVNQLKWQAQQDIMDEGGPIDHQTPIISTGDVLLAWAIRLITSSESGPHRPVTAISAFNARFTLPELNLPAVAYPQNMFLETFTLLSAPKDGSSAHGSLGRIALAHRLQVAKQTTAEQTRSQVRAKYQPRARLEFYGPDKALPIVFNNVSKANVLQTVNFGPAVLAARQAEPRRPGSGSAVYHHFCVLKRRESNFRNVFAVFGKDLEGNYWMTAALAPWTWDKLQDEFDNLPSASGKVAAM
ncbi:hypothetical protein XA68_16374 [Ophiocordyceps unilateralis]|uniref:Uncharacterized protein n=1 Tax=Ophiocordyceps unilateralis TaxID=268505 RepID=A0A2A9PKK2_OPHUN|nr:hypothetical protein XA68_16374 [Ophiocordyceps unilateralis]